ncbi:tRNA CCA-pyrophosphorylase [Natrinema pellirubrum DSM 15624]|uniref:CCA-adding enzyme n=1 Tax=Natrinema pellirubrum (strain DSM 15624 / CIP 106293 / JCM 10476 / NCIMB 786 / 157) TaxID=797303 RepID=L0JRF5_NATP1|nr:CCA tRNA nucleotidyltransferase [Natrinema pellirubrum]AGB33212.1 CCA-adding enzyme [Natrinema pellirubrum DSM 15624]ELY71578.1 tRNA CCA-pyrophosphorylase [Natrinema pellirubrum DSM 15624]
MSEEDADRDGPEDGDGDRDLEAVLAEVRDRVTPDEAERTRLREVADRLIDRAEAAATDRCDGADVLQVGSTARNTWIAGDRDIDIFVRFPPELDRETLEEYGLAVGHATLPSGHEEYAEHPYVKGEVEGFDIDVVPCFRLESATEIRSAVDRTPFHTQYLQQRLDDELAGDVRLTKQFLKGIGVYGSDLRTRGFSGYLTELLVCEYGGFRPLLEAAADWRPPVELDPEDHGTKTFDDPLVIIDPTDPERNVAAVCSAANVARFQHYARSFLESPRSALFEPETAEPLTEAELRDHLERRGTTPVAVRFDAPDLVEDQLYPQLRKSLDGITRGLDERGFDVFRATTMADGDAVVFVELAVSERPGVERHEGPPVHVRDHAGGFYGAYADDPQSYGPFIEDDRYVTEREREFTTACEFLESDRLFDVGLGAHVETTLEDGYEVLVGKEVTALIATFGAELAAYFEPRP